MSQENQAYSSESRTSQRRTNENISDGIIKLKVPLHMVDFKFMVTIMAILIAFIILSLVDHLYRTIWTYLGVVLINVLILTVIYIMARYEISIYDDKLTVKKPFFRELKLPAKKIIGISSFNNSIYKYRKLYFFVYGLIMLLLTTLIVSNNSRIIELYGLENATNISTVVLPILMFSLFFFRAYQMSHYDKAIKIDINPGEIKLYPENKQKYKLLKDKLNCLLR